MSRLPFPQPARAAVLVAAATCALWAASCTESLPPVGQLSDIGVLEGRLLETGRPVAAELCLRALNGQPMRDEIVARADSNGWYRLEAPLGLYAYWVRWPGTESMYAPQPDTVSVGRSARRRDFATGRGRVVVRLPAEFSGLRMYLDADARNHSTGTSAIVVGDTVEFILPMLPPAAYGLDLSVALAEGDLIIVGESGVALDSLRVRADAPTTLRADFRDNCATIAGRITGSPLLQSDEVRIEAYTTGVRRRITTWCDADGRYRLHVLAPQPFRLRVKYHDDEYWFGGTRESDATLYDLQPGVELADLDLAACGLRLRFDGPGDLIDNGAALLLVDAGGAQRTLPNYDGRENPVELELLPPGQLRVYVLGACAGQPWRPEWYDGATDLDGATPITLTTGQLADVAIDLHAGGVIEGRFIFHNDDSYWGTPGVVLHDTAGNRLCPTQAPQSGLTLDLRGVPDGTFLLGMYISSLPWWYPGTYALAEAVPVTVTGGGTVSGLVWEMPFPYKGARP